MSRSVLVVAGEVSGDMHAAAVVRRLREAAPDWTFWGIGGDRLREAGMEVLVDARDMAVMGLSEVLRRFWFFRRVFHGLLAEARARKPDAVLLVDYPGFNLRFAEAVHGTGSRVLYYICPQVWAWHRARIGKMARIVDRLLVIFPFETEVFAHTGLAVDFVGHPLVDEAAAARQAPEATLPWAGATERIALLPGSRRQEVDRIFLPLWDAAARLQERRPDARFIVAAASEELAHHMRVLASGRGPRHADIVTGQTRQVLRQARAAWVASGTATLEACLMRCPMVVVYRTAALTYLLAKRLVRVPHIGMVNIVAGRGLCPEFIQHQVTPDALAEALNPLVDDTPERRAMVEGLEETAAKLGGGGAAARAAEAILNDLKGNGPR